MDKKDKKELSCVVTKALDTMKYGYDDIKARVKIYKTHETVRNKSKFNNTFFILAGSRAEGVSYAGDSDSDIDIMGVEKQWICFDDLNICDIDPEKIAFEMVRDNNTPGYTWLKCKDSDQGEIESKDFPIQEIEGQKFFGHSLNADNLSDSSDEEEYSKTVSGPAYSYVFSLSSDNTNSASHVQTISVDGVTAVQCICPEHLQKWKDRKRFNNWPGQDLIEEISQMNGHVVPVGSKGSENAHLEWRICYTEAELKLIHSLNEIQLKLYVLLRMVTKKILKPICADISSYIMKNVLFWFVERSPAYRFKAEHLMGLLYLALRFLQHCIHRRHLSNYMIPERNLFAGRFDDSIKTRLVEKLHQLIYVQGPSFFFHYEGFKPLCTAVANIQPTLDQAQSNQSSALKTPFSKSFQECLQEAFESDLEYKQEFLTTLLSELTEEQIEHNILDIVHIFHKFI